MEWVDENPSFLASGQQITYSHYDSCDPRRPDGIYLMRSDGSGGRLILRSGHEQLLESPGFSPDGRWLAFNDLLEQTFIARAGRPRAFKLISDITDDEELLRYSQIVHPAWSSHGRLALTLTGQWGTWESWGHIGSVTRTGTDLRLLTRSRRDGMADWSPSADRVVFHRRKAGAGKGDVFITRVKPRSGQHPRRVTTTRDAFIPAWSPNERSIAYVRVPDANRSARGSLWIMRVNGHGKHLVATNVYADIGLGESRISWQPRPRR
jgi:Tol biopolymer transport system component